MRRHSLALSLVTLLALLPGLASGTQGGMVRANGLPIPGAVVTAVQGNSKVVTATDEAGRFTLPELSAGAWTVTVEMTGFGPVTKTLEGGATQLDFDLRLAPLTTERAASAAPTPAARTNGAPAPTPPGAAPRAATGATGQRPTQAANRAFQRVDPTASALADLQAQVASAEPERSSQDANEAFLVNGSLSRGLGAPQAMDAAFSRGDMGFGPGGPAGNPFGAGQSAGGGPGGGPGFGGGGPGGGPGFGGGGPGGGFGGRGGPGAWQGRRGPNAQGGPRNAMVFGNRSARRQDFHGNASFSLRNSALDASPYSINGQNVMKPSYAQSRFSLSGGGPLRIPKLFKDENTFLFVSYFGTRARNPYSSFSTVPTEAERTGDFSQVPTTIYDPTSHQPFPGNVIPASLIDPAATGMLSLFPLPNYPGLLQNYSIVSSVPANSDNFGVRVNRNITSKDRLAGAFNMQERSGDNLQLFGFQDTSSGQGINTSITWTHTLSATFLSNLRVYYSRNSNSLSPYFAYGTNWAQVLGIAGTSQNPVDFGPPNLSFTNFGGLSDGNPQQQHNQTAGFTESVTKVRGKHTVTAGFDYHRMQMNSLTDQNARGTYTFSGLATSAFSSQGFALPNTGFDLADYLLGLPQSSSIRYGFNGIYFRGSVYSAYVQDDWRVNNRLSLNIGVRYEYQTPLHEKYGQMANLDIAPHFADVAVVTPSTPGPYTGQFPDGLVNPDKNNVAPRFGLAWKPFTNHSTVVRAGYGIYYNPSVYTTAASRMSQQPPFAQTQSLNTSTEHVLTIADGFLNIPLKEINNTYAIDRFYKVGYAQTWSASIQQNLPWSSVLEVGYLGTKGTDLDVQTIPNSAPPGSPLNSEQRRAISDAVGFIFDSSVGNSIYNAGQVRFSRRFRSGISGSLFYTYSKSIDDASSIGGSGSVVAQNAWDLAAERGLSSFDHRHALTASFLFSTSGSPSSRSSRSVWLRDWQLSGSITAQSGSPFTATVLGNQSDAAGTGNVGSARADATGIPLALAGYYFNPAAFTLPANGQYGNAGRNTISGPPLFSVNATFGRTIRLGERKALDLRVEANNVFNMVSITSIGTTINSAQYGLALAAGSMRSMNLVVRFHF